MSKRSRRVDEEKDELLIQSEIKKRFTTHRPPSKDEIDKIRRILSSKLDNLYNDFIIALKKSRYGRYMIEGLLGKERQEAYKPFYERLIREGFIKHFIVTLQVLRVVMEEEQEYFVLMDDIFPIIYKKYLVDNVYLGNYITHTETLAVDNANGGIYIIKNNDNAYENKRLLLYYKPEPFSFYIRDAEFVSRDVEIVSVVSSQIHTVFMGFNNDLYMIIRDDNEEEQQQIVRTIEHLLDDKMELVEYKKEGIRIKALFSLRQNVYLLTTRGRVYVVGDVSHSQISKDAIDQIKNIHIPVEHRNNDTLPIINTFIPISFVGTSITPNIVYIDERFNDATPALVDENNVVYHLSEVHGSYERMNDEYAQIYLNDVVNGRKGEWDTINKQLLHFDDEHLNVELDDEDNSASEEYWSDESKYLAHNVCEMTSGQKDLYVLLTNQRIYHFTQAQWNENKYKLVQVVLNKPILWDSSKKKADTWIFQCYHCEGFKSTMCEDKCIDGVFCSLECQNSFYYRQFKKIHDKTL